MNSGDIKCIRKVWLILWLIYYQLIILRIARENKEWLLFCWLKQEDKKKRKRIIYEATEYNNKICSVDSQIIKEFGLNMLLFQHMK